MGTVTISAAGFASTPVGAPSFWPGNVTYPSNQSPNGTKVYTVSDADWLALLAWVAANYEPDGATPTAAQLLLQWLASLLVQPTILGVQRYRSEMTIPPPITIA